MPGPERAARSKRKTRHLWLAATALAAGCVPYVNKSVKLPALSPVPRTAQVTLLGTRVDGCLGGCPDLKRALRRGLAQALEKKLGWKLVPHSSTARSVDFRDRRTCLIQGREPPGWGIAVQLMRGHQASRGAWVNDALFGAASIDAAVRITLWNPQRLVVLDHLVAMSEDNEKNTESVFVTPQVPLNGGFASVSFAPNTRGTNLGIAEQAARTGMSALSLALKPETSNFTLVFNDDDARAKPPVALAKDGNLTAALAQLQRIEPRSASVEYDLGMVQLGLGNADQALQHFEAAQRGGLRTGMSARHVRLILKRRAYETRFPHPACWVAPQQQAQGSQASTGQ